MEIEPGPDRALALVRQADRDAALEALKDAAGDGRLTLEEFGDRVSLVLAAGTMAELQRAMPGLEVTPPASKPKAVSTVVTFLGDQRRLGRWRLPRALRAIALLGDVHLDLRGVVVSDEVIDIYAVTLLGSLYVAVPDGVDVELTGFDLLGDRELRLAPGARRPGMPLIRVHAYGLLGDVTVRAPIPGEEPPSWWRGMLGHRRT